MSFNPLKEKGVALEKQVRDWKRLNVTAYRKDEVHPYTRTRIILMNGIEVEGTFFSHQFARHAQDAELKQRLAMTRRIEQQQQKTINWMAPADETVLEMTIGYEQVAVDLTAYLARTEPDRYVKAALDFALLEDFDHLYRYANLLQMTQGKEAEKIVNGLTEITPGRPTKLEHRHPYDSVRNHYDRKTADPLTKLHVLTIVSGEQQTMNFYNNVGNRPETQLGRGLYLEIAQIEEQHVSHYESLADPAETWLEQLLWHEYNECYMYYSCMDSETDSRMKKFWQENLDFEITHLHEAAELMKKYEKRDPDELLPDALPELTIFRENKEYVRDLLAEQTFFTAFGTEFVPLEEAPSRFEWYQKQVNADSYVPSELVIEEKRKASGKEYRLETDGPHPVEELRV